MAEIQRAKADGRWKGAYDSARASTVPEDLERALQPAKKAETRARRLADFLKMLERGRKIHEVPRKRTARPRPASAYNCLLFKDFARFWLGPGQFERATARPIAVALRWTGDTVTREARAPDGRAQSLLRPGTSLAYPERAG